MVKNKDDFFSEKEIDILRLAIDKAEKRSDKKTASAPLVKSIINEVEFFLKKKKLVCYGGTAINNILPEYDQFYDKSLEIPEKMQKNSQILIIKKDFKTLKQKAEYITELLKYT